MAFPATTNVMHTSPGARGHGLAMAFPAAGQCNATKHAPSRARQRQERQTATHTDRAGRTGPSKDRKHKEATQRRRKQRRKRKRRWRKRTSSTDKQSRQRGTETTDEHTRRGRTERKRNEAKAKEARAGAQDGQEAKTSTSAQDGGEKQRAQGGTATSKNMTGANDWPTPRRASRVHTGSPTYCPLS